MVNFPNKIKIMRIYIDYYLYIDDNVIDSWINNDTIVILTKKIPNYEHF